MIAKRDFFRIAGKVFKIYSGYRIPIKVTQYLTYKCNLNCGFCGRCSVESEELSTGQITKCISDFKELGAEFWGFNGGEPLLRQDVGELISFCKKVQIKTSMSTNGTLISQRIEDIKDLDLALISIDGPEAIHDKIRGVGSFRRTLDGLEAMKRKNKRFIIVTVLNSDNVLYLEELMKLAEFYNCLCMFQPVFMHTSDKFGKATRYIPDQMIDAAGYLEKQKRLNRPVANSFAYLDKIRKYPNLKQETCWASRFFCVIAPNGNVFPCCNMLSLDCSGEENKVKNWKQLFKSLPAASLCKGCFIFCYSEYNLLFNNPIPAVLRFTKNLLANTWLTK